ncbi:MAG: hypothetical protein ACD_58C00213G0009 [uncultured bacterium]|nr:MAG: hypothetical protein ACD_58C00213G0009 [uncultured bacterium]
MKRKKQTSLIETLVLSLLRGLWFLLCWPIKKILKLKTKNENINKVQNLANWLIIEKMLESGDEIHAKQAIIEADKFFDSMMKQVGAKGDSFADRLRSLESKMDYNKYQQVWNSHKVRNQISHEMGYKLTSIEAGKTLNNFKLGLHNLGAI